MSRLLRRLAERVRCPTGAFASSPLNRTAACREASTPDWLRPPGNTYSSFLQAECFFQFGLVDNSQCGTWAVSLSGERSVCPISIFMRNGKTKLPQPTAIRCSPRLHWQNHVNRTSLVDRRPNRTPCRYISRQKGTSPDALFRLARRQNC